MAIHPEFPGVEVTIEVDGVALREYASDEDQQPQVTTTCYVESQAGKNFIVMLKFPEDFAQMQQSDIEAILTVDGQRMRSLVIHGAKNGRGQKSWDGVRDKEGETCLLRKFMFAPLNMGEFTMTRAVTLELTFESTDSASQSASTGTPEEIGQLGQIVVTFNRGTYRRGSDSHISKQVRAFKDLGKIDEKMLKGKAISHSAAYVIGFATQEHANFGRLGDAVPASSTPTPCKFDVKEENPFASFKILYRSHG